MENRQASSRGDGCRMTLSNVLSVLSKSSPYSVATQSERPTEKLDKVKEYLYVEQEIETHFRSLLDQSEPGQLIFLCGSSGDGKSEILTRAYREYSERVEFHLDATHGFEPQQTAIQALDQVFDEHNEGSKPLAVGINTGMMSNYVAEGSERHGDLREAISSFLGGDSVRSSGRCHFVDFESYPKFRFDKERQWLAPFSSSLMNRLTDKKKSNPFSKAAELPPESEEERRLLYNFRLFSLPQVQRNLNKLLFRARLEFDQFITTRALLDFLHHLLTGPGSLVDNLYSGGSNDLAQKIVAFDPAECHSREIDRFRLAVKLGSPPIELPSFLKAAIEIGFYIPPGEQPEPRTLLRYFALCQEMEIGNNYHHFFRKDLRVAEGAFDEFARVWTLHSEPERFQENRADLIKFYTKRFISAIQTYINRRSPWLPKGQMYLQELNGVVISADCKLRQPSKLVGDRGLKASYFAATIKTEESAQSIQVTLPLFNLLTSILNGYRPTRYDTNATVMLDDFVSRLTLEATRSNRLSFTLPNMRCLEVEKIDEDYFETEMKP